MSHGSTTFKLVEEAIISRIVALDASAYTDGRRAKSKWHESTTPLSVVNDPSSLGHLSANVWIQNAPNTNDSRSMTWEDNDVDNDVEIDARVKVAFTFNLRATQQTADARLATDAAVDVIRAIMAPWTAADQTAYGAVTMRLVDGLQPALTIDAEWLLITQDYLASFDLDLLPDA